MRVTLSLGSHLVRKVRKIAVDRATTLTALVRDYLQGIAEEDESAGHKRKALNLLERSFELLKAPVGKRKWTRASLYERS
jgi:hypothetical protein